MSNSREPPPPQPPVPSAGAPSLADFDSFLRQAVGVGAAAGLVPGGGSGSGAAPPFPFPSGASGPYSSYASYVPPSIPPSASGAEPYLSRSSAGATRGGRGGFGGSPFRPSTSTGHALPTMSNTGGLSSWAEYDAAPGGLFGAPPSSGGSSTFTSSVGSLRPPQSFYASSNSGFGNTGADNGSSWGFSSVESPAIVSASGGAGGSSSAAVTGSRREKKSPHSHHGAHKHHSASNTSSTNPPLSDEAQVHFLSVPHESVFFNDVMCTHTYMDMGATPLSQHAAVGVNPTSKSKSSASKALSDEALPTATSSSTTSAPLTESDYLLLDTATSTDHDSSVLTHAHTILSNVAQSFSSSHSFVSEIANHHSQDSTQAFLAILNRRAFVIHTNLDAIRAVEGKIFQTLKPTAIEGKDKLLRVASKDTTTCTAIAPKSLFDTSITSVAASTTPATSSASPTLRMLVLSFFPLLQSISTQDHVLKQSVMSTLLSVLTTLPTLGLKSEPIDCLQQFRLLVQQETGTKPRLTNSTTTTGSGMTELSLTAAVAKPQVSSTSTGLALTTLLALALQQGQLVHILEAITSCLQVSTETQAAIRQLETESGSGESTTLVSKDHSINLSLDYFLHQLQTYRVNETLPQLTSATYVTGWQHHSHRLKLKAPHKCNIELPIQRSDSTSAAATAAAAGGANDTPFLGSIATDGTFLYLYTLHGLSKVGTGYHGTIAGHVYQVNEQFPKLIQPTTITDSVTSKKEKEKEKVAPSVVSPKEQSDEPERPSRATKKKSPSSGGSSSSGTGSRGEEKSGGLVYANNRLFFATPNFTALFAATSSHSSASKSTSSSSVSATAVDPVTSALVRAPLLREVDPVTLEELGEVDIIYKPKATNSNTTKSTKSTDKEKESKEKSTPTGAAVSPAASDSSAPNKDSSKDKKEKDSTCLKDKELRESLPFYVSVTSDSTFIYGLYMNLNILNRKHRSSSSTSTPLPHGHPNTIGFANLVDVFSVHPTLPQVTFLRTIVLEETDGRMASGSKYDGMDRTMLPPNMSPTTLGLQTIPANVAYSASTSSGFGDSSSGASSGVLLLPYKTFVTGGGIGSTPTANHSGYFVRMPTIPRLAAVAPPMMSFKPDIFCLTTGQCLSRGGWEQRTYDNPASTLVAHHVSPQTAHLAAPRGTAICYDARNDLIIDYSPLTLNIAMWSNGSHVRHTDYEEYHIKRMQRSALASGSSSTAASSNQLLTTCAAILHHLARLAHAHQPTPPQLSLIGVSTGKYVTPVSPFSNLGLPSTTTATNSANATTTVAEGIDTTIFSKSQAMCMQVEPSTFELLHDLLFVLGRSLLEPSVTMESGSIDSIYHMMITGLKVLRLNLSVLSPPPIQTINAVDAANSTVSTATNTPMLSSVPAPAATPATAAGSSNPLLTPRITQQLKKLLLSFIHSVLPATQFSDAVPASNELHIQALTTLLAGLSHFYATPSDLVGLILSPLGSHPLVVQYLVQYPRLCLVLSNEVIEKEVIHENGLINVLLRRVLAESRQQLKESEANVKPKSTSPVTEDIPISSSEISVTVVTPGLTRVAPILTPNMQLLSFFHRSLLSRMEVDSMTRQGGIAYCTTIVKQSTLLLKELSGYTANLYHILKSSIVGVLLPPILTLLLRASAPPSSGITSVFVSLADSLTQLVKSPTGGQVGPLVELIQQIHQYHEQKLEVVTKTLTKEQWIESQSLDLIEVDRAVQTIESPHPYVSVDSQTTASSLPIVGVPPFMPKRIPSKAYAFRGADYLVLVFDPRCSSGHKNDVLTIQSMDGRKLVGGVVPTKTALHPTSTSTPSAGTSIELSLNTFPRTPIVVPGDTVLFSFSPEGTIRERERGTSAHHPHVHGSHQKSLLYYGYKVTVYGMHFRGKRLNLTPTAFGESGVQSLEWSMDLLNTSALVAGHATQLTIFPPILPPTASVASPSSLVPAAPLVKAEAKPDEKQSQEIQQLLRSELFANHSPNLTKDVSTNGPPPLEPFLQSIISGTSVEWIDFLFKKIPGRPPLSGEARKYLTSPERVMLAAIIHNMDLVRVAQSVSEEIRQAAQDHATAIGSTTATLPPPTFSPSHKSFPLLKQAWSILYQLDSAYLARARLEKKYMDLLCLTTKVERETEVKGYDNKQLIQLLELKRVLNETEVAAHTTAATPATTAAATPAAASSPTTTAAAATTNEGRHQQLVDKLMTQIDIDRAFYLSHQAQHTPTSTMSTITESKEESKEKEEKMDSPNSKNLTVSSPPAPTPVLTLTWEDAYRTAGMPFMSRSFLLLELRPAAAPWSTIPQADADGVLIHHSLSAVNLPVDGTTTSGGSSSASSVTGSPKLGGSSSPSLGLTRSFTDVRKARSTSSADADTLPLVRANSLTKSISSVQRQLLHSSSSSKNLPSVGREVVGNAPSRTNSGTNPSSSGPVVTQDLAQSLQRWKSWQRGPHGTTPPRVNLGSTSPVANSADPTQAFHERIQLIQRFINSSLDANWIVSQVSLHRTEAQARIEGMHVLNQELLSVLPSAKLSDSNVRDPDAPSLDAMNGLLLGLSECIRNRWVQSPAKHHRHGELADPSLNGPHYLIGIEGVGFELLNEVRLAFASLLTTFSKFLSASTLKVHATSKMLILSCIALFYQSPMDITVLKDSQLISSIYQLIHPTGDWSQSKEPSPSASLATSARTLFCQLATIILVWTPVNDGATNAALSTLQEEVLKFLFELIQKEVKQQQSATETEVKVKVSEATSTKSSNIPYKDDSALYSYLLLFHTLRESGAVRKFLSQPDTLLTMLNILHINTALLDQSSASAAATILDSTTTSGSTSSLRIQRLLIRLIRSMLTASSEMVNRLLHAKPSSAPSSAVVDVASKQRVFISSLFDRIGELLSGGITSNTTAETEHSTSQSSSSTVNKSISIQVEESKESIPIEKKESEEKEKASEEKVVESSLAVPSASPDIPSPSPEPLVETDKTQATYSLTVYNTDSENVTGSVFASNLYAATKDIFKSLSRSTSGSSGSSNGGSSSKGDYRAQLSATNHAIIFNGSKDECIRIGKQMSGRGFVCSMTPIPPSDGLVRNLALEVSNPSFFLSAPVALSITAEYVTLIQVLGSTMLWSGAVEAEIIARVKLLAQVKVNEPITDGAVQPLSSSLSVLAVLSGFKDSNIRRGAKVIVQSLDKEDDALLSATAATDSTIIESGALTTATVLKYEPGRNQATVVMDAVDGTPTNTTTTIAAARLRPFTYTALLRSEMLVQPVIIDTILTFLQQSLTPLSTSSSATDFQILHQELILYSLRFISTILSHPRHSHTLLKRMDLISLLVASAKKCPAASCGFHASASHLAQLEQQSARLLERWLDLTRPIHWRNADVDAEQAREQARRSAQAGQVDENSMQALVPYQPNVRTIHVTLPTAAAIDNAAKYLMLETTTVSKPGRPASTIIQFTREVQVHIPADFLVGLGGRGLDSRSSGSVRRLEEQLRVEAANLGIGDAEYCVLGNAPIDLTLTEYYFEVTLHSSNPISVGLSPRVPPSSNISSEFDEAQHSGGRSGRSDPSQALQLKLQQLLRARTNPWPQQSIRYQGKDGRVIRKVMDSPNIVAGKDEVKSYTESWGTQGDVVGVHWNLVDGTVAFTRNGRHLGTAITISMGGSSRPGASPSSASSAANSSAPLTAKLYPAVSMTQAGTRVSFNFGATPFMYKLPKLSTIVESDEARAERLKRAQEAEKLAAQRESEAATRKEVERLQLQVQRDDMAQSILDMTGGLLPSRRHALMALQLHRWDASLAGNWLLENESAAIQEINRRIREEDAEKASENARQKEITKAKEEKSKAATKEVKPAGPVTPKAKPPTSTSSSEATIPTTYDHAHSSSIVLTPSYTRPLVPIPDTEESDPHLEDWLQSMESILIGARLERPELVQQLMRQLRAGGEERANALLSLPANVQIPVLKKPEPKSAGLVAQTQPIIQMGEVKIGMRAQVNASAIIRSAYLATLTGDSSTPAASSTSTAASSWLPAMQHLHGRIVTISDVDREHLDTSELVRIHFESLEQSTAEEWWIPLSALRQVEDTTQADAYIGMLELSDLTKYRYVNQQLANLLARQAVMALLSNVGDELLQSLATAQATSLSGSNVELVDLMEIIASERVSTLQLMPSVSSSSTTNTTLPTNVPVPPILNTLFNSTLQTTPTLLSSLFAKTTRELMSDTTVIDTDQEGDRELVGGDNNTAGTGEMRQLTAGENASGLLVSFSTSTRLPKSDDRIVLFESSDPTAAAATVSASSPLTLNQFTSPATKNVVARFIGGDKPKDKTPLYPFFYPLSTNPLTSLYLQLSKDRGTAVRTIRLKAEVVPVPSSNKFGLGVWMCNRIIDHCSSLVVKGGTTEQEKDTSAWRAKLRSMLSAVGGFLLTPRLPPIIRISLFQLLVRGLYMLRDISPQPYPEPIDLHMAALYKEMTTLHRTMQSNNRSSSGSSSVRSTTLPFYAIQPQYVSVYFQSLLELVATYRRIFGDHVFKSQVIDADSSASKLATIKLPTSATAAPSATTPSKGSITGAAAAAALSNIFTMFAASAAAATSTTASATTSSSSSASTSVATSSSGAASISSSSSATITTTTAAASSTTSAASISSASSAASTPASVCASSSSSVAASTTSASASSVSAPSVTPRAAPATPSSSSVPSSSPFSSVRAPVSAAKPLIRREPPAIQVEQLVSMGFTVEYAEAALMHHESLNDALDALMSGFAPPPPERQERLPELVVDPQANNPPALPSPIASPVPSNPSAAASSVPPISASAVGVIDEKEDVPPVVPSAEHLSDGEEGGDAGQPSEPSQPESDHDDEEDEDEEEQPEQHLDDDGVDEDLAAAIAMSMSMAEADEKAAAAAAAANSASPVSPPPAQPVAPVTPVVERKEEEKKEEVKPIVTESAPVTTSSSSSAATVTPIATASSSASTTSTVAASTDSSLASTPSASTVTAPSAISTDSPIKPIVVAPLSAPLVTEQWFDHFCAGLSLLDAFCTNSPLPVGAAQAAVDLSTDISSSKQTAAAASLESEHSKFTPAIDAEIIAFANEMENKFNTKLMGKIRDVNYLSDLTALVTKGASFLNQYPLLNEDAPVGISLGATHSKVIHTEMLVRRLALLIYLNYLIHGSLSLIDLSVAAASDPTSATSTSGAHSFAHHLSFFRSLILTSVKSDFFHSVLDITSLEGEAESKKFKAKVSVDRLLAASRPGLKHSIFHQVYQQLANTNPVFLVPTKPRGDPHTSFDTSFRGEHVVGESGPYREIMNDMVRELQTEGDKSTTGTASAALPFLIPSINHRTQFGDGRDRWILNPSCISDSEKQHLTFIGLLMGMAIRTGVLLPFAFPKLIWQQLLDIQPTRADLEGIDASFVTGVLIPLEDGGQVENEANEAQLEEQFNLHFGDTLTWSTTLSDGSSIDLKPNGSTIPVQFAERKEYARLAEWARLNENREQIRALSKGLRTIIPASVLSLFTASEFERLVCGVPFIDIDLLKRHTEYSGVTPNDQHIQWFWTCLQEMTQEERRAFLVFSSAQQRMPSTDDEFTTRSGQKIRMLIKAATNSKKGAASRDNPDSRFMTADTCFWNVSLPVYSSLEVMRKMLGIVLTTSSGMDGDDVQQLEREHQADFEPSPEQEEEFGGSPPVDDEPIEDQDEDGPDDQGDEDDDGGSDGLDDGDDASDSDPSVLNDEDEDDASGGGDLLQLDGDEDPSGSPNEDEDEPNPEMFGGSPPQRSVDEDEDAESQDGSQRW